MHTKSVQNIAQAVSYIQSLPTSVQQEMVDWIALFQNKKSQANTDTQSWQSWCHENQAFLQKYGLNVKQEPSEMQKRFLAWRADYEQLFADDDDWTDEMHDEIWDNVRDKNDFGREINFDE